MTLLLFFFGSLFPKLGIPVKILPEPSVMYYNPISTNLDSPTDQFNLKSNAEFKQAIKEIQQHIFIGLSSNKYSLVNRSIIIQSKIIGKIESNDVENPSQIVLKLLYALYRAKNESVQELLNLCQFIGMDNTQFSKSLSLLEVEDVYSLLKFEFPDQENYQLFYIYSYYNHYLKLINNEQKLKLIFLKLVGWGTSGVTLKVKNLIDHQIYALKIFNTVKKSHLQNKNQCIKEQSILFRIQTEINATNLKVPRIYGKYCEYLVILMQYIDGQELLEHDPLSKKQVGDLLNQLSFVINKLGAKGIGHFDIHPRNIMIEKNESFWLIDFGHAVDITCIKYWSQISAIPLYYSPQNSVLNEVIYQEYINNVLINKRELLLQLIIDSNLYSLEASALFCAVPNDDRWAVQINVFPVIDAWVGRSFRSKKDRREITCFYEKHVWKSFLNRAEKYHVDDKQAFSHLLNYQKALKKQSKLLLTNTTQVGTDDCCCVM